MSMILAAFALSLAWVQSDNAAASVPQPPACEIETFETSRFLVCAYMADRHDLRLVRNDLDPQRSRRLDALLRDPDIESGRVRFAMNAGMFEESGRPLGLYVGEGRAGRALNTRSGHRGNFYLMPNGVLFTDGRGHPFVVTSADWPDHADDAVWASQSGPMLVIDGALHPAIQHDGPSRRVRNGVGVIGDGAALFVLSLEPVSFGRLARFFRDGLGSENALYLDGVVSGAWVPSLPRLDLIHRVGPVFVISERERR